MRARRVLAALAAVVSCVAAAADPAARGDAAPTCAYVRDADTPEKAVRAVMSRAAGDDAVLFVFDTATFDPPKGRSEFAAEHLFRDDLAAWAKALAAVAPTAAGRVFVAATTSTRPVDLAGDKAFAEMRVDLNALWWTAAEFKSFEPAHKWAARLLSRLPGKKRTLALVVGSMPPERWIRRPPFGFGPDAESWRAKLCDVGAYWDEEKVGAAAASAGATLDVVAPEARFGDFLPLDDVPWAPWASRPVADPTTALAGAENTTPGRPPSDAPSMSDEAIRRLEETLRKQGVPEEAIRQIVESMRRRGKGGGDAPDKKAEDDPVKGGRFHGATPRWTPMFGQQTPFATDVPSTYGWWPYARAAARTGGTYVFYPFPHVDWADACPRDSSLVDAMAPEVVPAAEFERLRGGDPALAAMLEAQRLVLDATPWSDGTKGSAQGGAASWCGFQAPGTRAAKWRPREKPRDWLPLEWEGKAKTWKALGARIAGNLEAYDRAMKVLDDAYAKLVETKFEGVPRRSQANLRLCRFWFATSAFHLEALSIYLRELERFMPPRSDDSDITITYVPTIRMSDVLDAYDGRTISPEKEKSLGRVSRSFGAGSPRGDQGNLLAIPASDRDYRARRSLDGVLANLDPRLRPRALRLVDAAKEVMARDAKSPWGWSVYYADVDTFVWVEVQHVKGDSVHPQPPADDGDDPGPTTPQGPGSGGGSPSTPK